MDGMHKYTNTRTHNVIMSKNATEGYGEECIVSELNNMEKCTLSKIAYFIIYVYYILTAENWLNIITNVYVYEYGMYPNIVFLLLGHRLSFLFY